MKKNCDARTDARTHAHWTDRRDGRNSVLDFAITMLNMIEKGNFYAKTYLISCEMVRNSTSG